MIKKSNKFLLNLIKSLDKLRKIIYYKSTILIMHLHIMKGSFMMYLNLRNELSSKKIKNEDIATLLNIHVNSVSNKINGKTDFTIKEAFRLRETLFPDVSFEYLFNCENI